MAQNKASRKAKGNAVYPVLKASVFQHLKYYDGQKFNYKQIAAKLNTNDTKTREQIKQILEELANENKITRSDRGKYHYHSSKNTVTGKIQLTKSGTGYLLMENVKDILIPAAKCGGAFDGDEVEVSLSPKTRGRLEGTVTRVVTRNKTIFTGVIDIHEEFAFFIPDSQKIHVDFFIPRDKLNGAVNGQKVVAEYIEWRTKDKNPIAKITKVLGYPGEHEAEMHAILNEFNLPYEFPEEVFEYAENISQVITDDEVAKRRDCRKIPTFTIDPNDAKDFDDALSYQKLKNGNIEVGVHIADVSHYMPEGSVLDAEAQLRATSVYLVDRVVPMLPEALSNGLCSLRPNEDKLCFSAIFEINEQAEVVKKWIGRTVIHSDKRFAYEDAQAIIEGEDGDFDTEIRHLDTLAKIMRKRRVAHGAIEFGGSEVKFILDEDFKPTGVFLKEAKDSNKLIEEYMLLANQAVAEFVGKVEGKPKTFVYRTHDEPNPEKLKTLKRYLRTLGLKLEHVNGKAAAFALNQMLKQAEGKDEENIIKQMTIRTMAKAEYTVENIGHYGLAFDYYTHFTSPIRRYPDVMVHRLLQRYLDGEGSVEAGPVELLCSHCSKQEKLATDAERASIKFMQVMFMKDRIGEEFGGVVSGVTNWGIYVEVDGTRCEGMVSLNSLTDDHYHFDEELGILKGASTNTEIMLGTRVCIKVKGADLMKKQLDYELVYVE